MRRKLKAANGEGSDSYNDAIRDKTEMPLRLVIGEDKKVTLEFTN